MTKIPPIPDEFGRQFSITAVMRLRTWAREAVEAAVIAEREACAALVDVPYAMPGKAFAEAIRNRA